MTPLKYIYGTRADEGMIRPDPAQEAALPEFDRIRMALAAPPPKKRGFFSRGPKKLEPIPGLYLWGGVGRGKSFLMDLFVTHVGVPKRRVHFHAFMQEIHAGMAEARKRGVEDALAPVAEKVINEIRLLAFDELQITDITDAMIVGRLFEMLFDAGVVVVATSNRHPDDLYKDGLNRQLFLPFIDLIKEKLTVWELASPTDYRQDRLAGEQVYFHPANAENRAQIDLIWQELTGMGRAPRTGGSEMASAQAARGLGSTRQEGLVLHVKGREVELPRFRNGVARASFWDLCGQMLGPADYLAVADAVRVLILEDIPQLDSGKFNEAKRFVTLIDALYEAGVKLIVTAADEPERLYAEGRGSFEFERTASRLREMQDADWGKPKPEPRDQGIELTS
ncbi:MAG: cell division protein ZapE [Mangrovicoccus sp.]|nr:cell division protein ZapE [Mangrovicoccus sp.]